MPDRNASSLGIVYKKAEELFRRLQGEMDQFYEWVILGTIDLDEYIDEVKRAKFALLRLLMCFRTSENARSIRLGA